MVQAYIAESDTPLAERVETANSFMKRLRGLMFTKELPPGSALYIHPCRSVHTFFMNYAIDVVYLNRSSTIVGIDRSLRPGQVGKHYKEAAAVLELPEGGAKEAKVGQKITWLATSR